VCVCVRGRLGARVLCLCYQPCDETRVCTVPMFVAWYMLYFTRTRSMQDLVPGAATSRNSRTDLAILKSSLFLSLPPSSTGRKQGS
jgi:hypothetical protein